MIRTALALAFASLACQPVMAQEVTPTTVGDTCLMAGMSYTEGASLRSGAETVVCRTGGKWVGVEADGASLCLYDNRAYSLGAIIRVSENVLLRCNQSGSWGSNQTE